MGGSAFAKHDPPIPTPRMPLEVYSRVHKDTVAILRTCFRRVETPIEAPEKDDFGDVDFLVTGPMFASHSPPHLDVIAKALAQILHAAAHLSLSANTEMHFAVPWPEELNDDPEGEKKYVQIDVHLCDSEQSLCWLLFKSAHGDLWSILGSTLKPFHVKVTDKIMNLVIPELTSYDRNKSLVPLTDDPSQVLQLLGLDEERYWRKFETREEMFQYAATSRFFWVKDDATRKSDEDGGGEYMTYSTRKSIQSRAAFREWIEVFIPRCAKEGKIIEPQWTSDSFRQQIFSHYPFMKERYESQRKLYLLEKDKETVKKIVKDTLLETSLGPEKKGAATREYKRILLEREPFEGKLISATMTDTDGFYDLDAVKDFVGDNWEKVADIGWERTMSLNQERPRRKEVVAKLKHN